MHRPTPAKGAPPNPNPIYNFLNLFDGPISIPERVFAEFAKYRYCFAEIAEFHGVYGKWVEFRIPRKSKRYFRQKTGQHFFYNLNCIFRSDTSALALLSVGNSLNHLIISNSKI